LLATDAFNAYKKATGATLDNATGLLTISTTQYNNLKNLNFVVGGVSAQSAALCILTGILLAHLQKTFALTPNAQIWPRALNEDIGGTSGKIYLIVNDLGSDSGEGLDFINGYTFLERFYSVYDTTNKRVGFATTSNTNSNIN
jgi:hypothetical protein